MNDDSATDLCPQTHALVGECECPACVGDDLAEVLLLLRSLADSALAWMKTGRVGNLVKLIREYEKMKGENSDETR